VKDFYKGNHKTLKIEIKENTRWKELPCSWISRINIFKCPYKVICRVNALLIKVPNSVLRRTRRKIVL
jgi:hypothetical protein